MEKVKNLRTKLLTFFFFAVFEEDFGSSFGDASRPDLDYPRLDRPRPDLTPS